MMILTENKVSLMSDDELETVLEYTLSALEGFDGVASHYPGGEKEVKESFSKSYVDAWYQTVTNKILILNEMEKRA